MLHGFELDLIWGVVLGLQVLWTQLGLAMGSGLSAGAAPLYAAWREDRFLAGLGQVERLWFSQTVFVTRWMDERWMLLKWGQRAERIRDRIKELLDPLLYGKELILEDVDDGGPFGFIADMRDGLICVRKNLGFREDVGSRWFRVRSSGIQGLNQFVNK